MRSIQQLSEPATTEQIFVFTGLSVVAFLLFVAVLVLLVRNVLKLYADQRSRVMGTRLRTRMLWGAVLVSLLPIAFMFAFSYGLMNRAVDRWFSQPVTEMRDDSNRMALELARYTTANARAEAESIAASLPELAADRTRSNCSRLRSTRRAQCGPDVLPRASRCSSESRGDLQCSAPARDHVAEWLRDCLSRRACRRGVPDAAARWRDGAGEDVAAGADGDEDGKGRPRQLRMRRATAIRPMRRFWLRLSATMSLSSRWARRTIALGTATMKHGGTVVVGLPMPYGMAATMTHLRTAADAYWTLFRERRQIRNLYMLLLLMMTSLALFASSWLALHLSKQVTKPVEALADAMEAIASGDYGASREGERNGRAGRTGAQLQPHGRRS